MSQASSPHSTVSIPINYDEAAPPLKTKNSSLLLLLHQYLHLLQKKIRAEDHRNIIHSIKVGIALVLVSLFYVLDSLYDQFGYDGMWAIMTVVLVFEFRAGATISKAFNRVMGTLIGGGIGCLAALLCMRVGGIGSAIAVETSVFIFGAAATYSRSMPRFKKRFEYGAMVFILTFNMVIVSGFRGDQIIKIASDRLSTIAMGLAICVLTTLLIHPMWASDELHNSLTSKFKKLALSIEECLKEYFEPHDEAKGTGASTNSNGYISVLHSKTMDETLANLAIWEPCHRKFGFSYPWDKYLEIGNVLRELAAFIHSLKGCLKSHQKPSMSIRLLIKEPCEDMGTLLSDTLKELGDGILNMRHCQQKDLFVEKLQQMGLSLIESISEQVILVNQNGNITDGLSIATIVFLLIEMEGKVEELVNKVEELGALAGFVSL